MAVSLERHSVPRWFHYWWPEHYEPRISHGQPYLACKRCGLEVWALTKHARNSHGDDVEDLPPAPIHAARGRFSDPIGRLVRTG